MSYPLEFFRQFRKQFHTTGSIAPSSRWLARALALYFKEREGDRPVRLLEIGPGTGAVTCELVRHLKPGDVFDLVELNDAFVDVLRCRFEKEHHFQAVKQQSNIFHGMLQDFHAEAPYDFIVSGLPLNNFSPDLVKQIFENYFELLAPGGVLSYFEYMYVRPIRKKIARGNERQRIHNLDAIIAPHLERHGFRRDNVLMNFPPAWVQHLRPIDDAVPSV
ncbi:MAG: methyltransferase domain-containing protein [Planctomycetota bacterium]|nr:methyltransferase domain-containing protein [Planctomycetota bacterium]